MAVASKMGISDSLIQAWRKTNDKGEKKTDQSLQQEVDSLRKLEISLVQVLSHFW